MAKNRSDYKALTVRELRQKLFEIADQDKVLTVAEGNEDLDYGVDLGIITDVQDGGEECPGQVLIFAVDLGEIPLTYNETLKKAVEAVGKFFEAQAVGEELDTGFDAGEFSGPAHADINRAGVERIAKEHGVVLDDLWKALNARDEEKATERAYDRACTCLPEIEAAKPKIVPRKLDPKKYNVLVNDVPALYRQGYFPRGFKYKKEAVECAKTAIANGASFVRVECPGGGELDFRRNH